MFLGASARRIYSARYMHSRAFMPDCCVCMSPGREGERQGDVLYGQVETSSIAPCLRDCAEGLEVSRHGSGARANGGLCGELTGGRQRAAANAVASSLNINIIVTLLQFDHFWTMTCITLEPVTVSRCCCPCIETERILVGLVLMDPGVAA